VTSLAHMIGGKIADLFAPRSRPTPRHPAYGFVGDMIDANTICKLGGRHLTSKLGQREYMRFVAGLSRDEQSMVVMTRKPIGMPDRANLGDALEAMANALSAAEIVSRKLMTMNPHEMEPQLREALVRFTAKLPSDH